MPRKIFDLNEHPTCPECGKVLDEMPARAFVVWRRDGTPSDIISEDRCGWCDAEYIARHAAGKVEIRSKY
jgi:hypothetical protein